MNIPCEQIRSDLSLDIAMDEVLPRNRMFEVVMEALSKERCRLTKYNKTKNVIQYIRDDGKIELILPLAVSFMGGQHNICRHRCQLKSWYKDVYEEYKNNSQYNIRILGVYHYQGNIIFIDFKKETKRTDGDIKKRLDEVGNKAGYIKELIKRDTMKGGRNDGQRVEKGCD